MNQAFREVSRLRQPMPWVRRGCLLRMFWLILLWLVAGPFFRYSDTWQLVVNTATTVFTYLAVFLIQNTQNR